MLEIKINYKFLNCGKSIENYFTCMRNNVAGFTKRFAKKGDIVYCVVKNEKVSYLVAKGLLGEETDKKLGEMQKRAYNLLI